MRDPDRIVRIIVRLLKVWHRNPDLRLGQLVCNIAGNHDPFYIEDDDFYARLTVFMERQEREKNSV